MEPVLVFSHIYKVPVIQRSSFGACSPNYESVGAPTQQLLYPTNARRKLINLTMWEKVTELYYAYQIDKLI